MLDGVGWEAVDLTAMDRAIVLDEPGATFEENARHKARQAAAAFPMWTLADDSGLEIDALGGEPGVRSARYAGEHASDADRFQKVLGLMSAVPDEKRTARFRCVVCVLDPAGQEKTFEGRCEGRIARAARGTGGFGYDPVFVPDGYTWSFAELGPEVKDRLSHRGRAMRQAVEYLQSRA
jgi:XTP/dITP diphosphohydrolase